MAYARWRERAAVVLAALLPDADGAPGLLETFGLAGQGVYVTYHRVAGHCLPGFVVVALLAATIAWKWPERWMLPTLRTKAEGRPIAIPSWRRLLAFASITVVMHLLGDWITCWGKMKLLWPFSDWDAQLGRVNSLDMVLCGFTVAMWGVQDYCLSNDRRRGAWFVAALWFAGCALYVWLRPLFGSPAYV